MSEHLTEQELIDYAYDLAPQGAIQQVRSHLETCESCRTRLECLKSKLGALELLREEIQPSTELIDRVVGSAAAPVRRTISLHRPLYWIGGIAAAIIIGCVLLISNHGPERKGGTKYVTNERMLAPERDSANAERPNAIAEKAKNLGTGAVATLTAAPPQAPALVPAPAQPSALETVEEPPFAPASAIELVVLPRRENVQLTIYNSADLTLVRERRDLTLKRGWNWLQFMWANTLIDPTSLNLEPTEHKDEVRIQQLVFPPRLRELGRWLIHSDVTGRVPFELTYFTSGLAWRAFYMGTLSQDEKTMRLESYVRVDNKSGEDYEEAQTRVIVGKVHLLDEIAQLARQQYPYGSPSALYGIRSRGLSRHDKTRQYNYDAEADSPKLSLMLDRFEAKEIRKEGLSEYFLYTIEGTETIPNQWGKRLLSFEASDIPVESLCKYDEQRWGDQTIRFLSFANDEEHKLGETPLPDGTVRIYGRTDEQGHLSYVGGMDVKYVPIGEEVELNLGPARFVEVKPVLMDQREENHVFDPNGNLTGWDDVRTWKVEIANAGTLPVEIEITRGFDTPYWELTPSGDGVTYTKHDVTHARFKLGVEPRSKRAFTYTATVYRGVRQTEYVKRNQK
jgi:hypothetical protein